MQIIVGTRSDEFLGGNFLDLVVIFLKLKDLHESFPGFAVLILIFFLTWNDSSNFFFLEFGVSLF